MEVLLFRTANSSESSRWEGFLKAQGFMPSVINASKGTDAEAEIKNMTGQSDLPVLKIDNDYIIASYNNESIIHKMLGLS